ncbi:MAG: LamG-like jellyroll fold domain-containing protein [Pirellulaceae bacterium]
MTSELNNEVNDLVSKLIDSQLSADEASRLETLLAQSPEAVKLYLELMDNHEALCAIYPGDVYADAFSSDPVKLKSSDSTQLDDKRLVNVKLNAKLLASAAALLIAVGLVGYLLGTGRQTKVAQKEQAQPAANEQTIAGHATLRRSVDVKWAANAKTYREGDVLPDGRLQIDQGIAEVDFFCGATLIVEGPATLDIESDWTVRVVQGRLRANVPPAARGFVVKAADTEIVDLGTEFALEVAADNARVEVIDGEIKLRGGQYDGNHLLTGEKQMLQGKAGTETFDSLSTLNDLQNRFADAETQRIAKWMIDSEQLSHDKRLIAYYPITNRQNDRFVQNQAASGSGRDGKLIGPVEKTPGRFGDDSAGLEFARPGARVRTRIDGEFTALTFACWTKIDSLDHVYNALFMADGYETGEPHWQIQNDGRMMFSVMVDDTQGKRHYSEHAKGFVESAGLARVYFSKPFWDISKSGQWFHLVAVFDPASQRVTQYVNGKQSSSESIPETFQIDQLRIGPSEIGNWGQPFRKTPWFAVRNLNGTIDELAIFDAALSENEIAKLYEQGKPLGY